MIHTPSKKSEKRLEKKLSQIYLDHQIQLLLELHVGYYVSYQSEVLGEEEINFLKEETTKMLKETPDADFEKTLIGLLIQDQVEEISDDEIIFTFLMERLYENAKMFHVSEFMKNPYFKNIKVPAGKKGNFELVYNTYYPYELLSQNTPKRLKGATINIPCIGCFDKEVKFPCILEDGHMWMSITPIETTTMQEPISHAKGKVLTLGCGLGYFAYMASLKDDVDSVTIIEKEQDVIDLFEENILPQFETKDKIKVIKADAFEYLETLEDGTYDYLFADIWDSALDVEPYLKVKQLTKKYRKTKCGYWIEDALILALSRFVYIEIMEAVGADMTVSTMAEDDSQRRQHDFIRRLLKGSKVRKAEDIDHYLNPRVLLSLIQKTKIEF